MKYLLFSAFLCILISCNNHPDSNNQTSNTDYEEDELEIAVANNSDTTLNEADKYKWENTKIEFGTPIVLRSTENVAIPIILENTYRGKMADEYNYFNIAIIDGSNQFKKFLFDESVVIQTMSTLESEMQEFGEYYYDGDDAEAEVPELYKSLILMRVSKYVDGEISSAERLFVYNLEEDMLTQLTPDAYDVRSWRVYRDVSKIIIRVAPDTNKNNEFDNNDRENIIIVDPNKPETKHPLFNLDELAKIKLQVLEEN
jgi:hypothetical protein